MKRRRYSYREITQEQLQHLSLDSHFQSILERVQTLKDVFTQKEVLRLNGAEEIRGHYLDATIGIHEAKKVWEASNNHGDSTSKASLSIMKYLDRVKKHINAAASLLESRLRATHSKPFENDAPQNVDFPVHNPVNNKKTKPYLKMDPELEKEPEGRLYQAFVRLGEAVIDVQDTWDRVMLPGVHTPY